MPQTKSETSETSRKIIHIDMDAFFAAVEQREQPELRGKPVVVGGNPQGRGVVATCSYEARRYGIHSAMPSARAYQLCPQAIFVRPRIALYREVSQQIQQIFRQYTDLIEPLSLDEAYLDVSHSDLCQGSASLIAQQIRQQIKTITGLTASAGVSYNKFLAKIASDINKPDGQFVITPQQGEAFVRQLPIGKFYGVGKVTEARMHKLGIYNGEDLRRWSLEELGRAFGKASQYYFDIARGRDTRPVNSHRIRKSFGSETTFSTDLHAPQDMLECVLQQAEGLIDKMQARQMQAYTLTLKVKYHDFRQVTRSISRDYPLNTRAAVGEWLPRLLERTDVATRPVRLLGVAFSGFNRVPEQAQELQLDLFE
jgi:DNA polymerase-4